MEIVQISSIEGEKGEYKSETGESETYLCDEQIDRLKAMFKDEKKYRYYMKAIWIFRSLAAKSCEVYIKDRGYTYDRNHPSFPIFDTFNEFINSLRPEVGYFENNGDLIKPKD